MNSRYSSKELIYKDQRSRRTVYKATELSGKLLCVKEQSFYSQEECGRARGFLDAQQASAHPNVCEIYSVRVSGDQDSFLLSVEMEWGGECLAEITQRKTHTQQIWTEAECLLILDHTLGALAHAESLGISHCNITPMSIYMCPQDIYKLSSFGDLHSSMIETPQFLLEGTPMFLSPYLRKRYTQRVTGEDAEALQCDQSKSDVYSLALTIVYLLNPAALKEFGNRSKLDSNLNSLNVTDEFRCFLRDMLSPDEKKRPTFAELVEKLPKVASTMFLDQINALLSDSSEWESKVYSLFSSLLKCSFPVSFSISIPSSVFPQCVKCGAYEIASHMLSCPHFSFCSINCRDLYMSAQGQDSCPYCIKPVSDVLPPSRKRRFRVIKGDQDPENPSLPQVSNPSKSCKVCGIQFPLDVSESWRLELLGSRLFSESNDICSQDCLNSLKEQASVPYISSEDIDEQQGSSEDTDAVINKTSIKQNVRLTSYVSLDTVIDVLYPIQQLCSVCHERPQDVFFFFHCQRHICCRKDVRACIPGATPALLGKCPECQISIHTSQLGNLILHQNDKDIGLFFIFLKCGIRKEIGGFGRLELEGDIPFPVTHPFLSELQRNKCHLCGQNLFNRDWRCFFHGSEPAFVCSKECVSAYFSNIQNSDTAVQCPACTSVIEGGSLALALTETSGFESYVNGSVEGSCGICVYGKADIYLSCGHFCCSTCFQHLITWDNPDFFPCLICGLGIHISEIHSSA